ncbi:MAG: hypothetical protein VXZ63_01575 [Planctomycetota bacterium]|nr:hypothetical protein [Planctomycetota bacterium]
MIQRSSVDLPQPLGPMNDVTRFVGIPIEMLWIAWKSPYQLEKSLISTASLVLKSREDLDWVTVEARFEEGVFFKRLGRSMD